jgi:hypothetical protein
VERRPVHRDGTHAAVVADRLGRGRHDVADRRCRATRERRGQRVCAQIDRQPCAPVVVEVGDQGKHSVRRGGVVGARLEYHRHQFEEDAFEEAVEVRRGHTLLTHAKGERAGPLGKGTEHRSVALVHRHLSRQRERLDDLPS